MTMANNSTSPAGFCEVLAFLEEGRHRLPSGGFITLNTFFHSVQSATSMRYSLTSEKVKLSEALKVHPVCSKSTARKAGLKLFTGPKCPVRAHGTIRRVSDGKCIACIEAAASLKGEAMAAGRDAALKKARAEVVREQKAAERERLKQEKAAEREREKVERQKAARAATRAKRKAERLPATGEQVARPAPLAV